MFTGINIVNIVIGVCQFQIFVLSTWIYVFVYILYSSLLVGTTKLWWIFCSAFNCSSSSDVKNELIFHKLVLIVVDYLVIIFIVLLI